MRSKGERRIAFGTLWKRWCLTAEMPHLLAYPWLCIPHLWNHIISCLLPHFILFWIHYSILKTLPKIYNVILPQFSPCQHSASSASHLLEHITKILHYKRSGHSAMNTNSTLFDLIRLEWSFDLSPRFNNRWPIMCQLCFLPCFPASTTPPPGFTGFLITLCGVFVCFLGW